MYSSEISTIEYRIMRNLDFIYQYGTVSMDVMGSVARDMFLCLLVGDRFGVIHTVLTQIRSSYFNKHQINPLKPPFYPF
jgi:hypothetical protein